MSGYRNYVPWKSNLPYKSGSGSTYASRDDVNTSDAKSTTPRFGSMASPAAYRPSYSGGTYRSGKRDTPPASVPYASRYGSSFTSSKDERETKPTAPVSKVQSTPQKYIANASNKENSLEQKISRYSTSTGNLAKYGRKSRDPSPATDRRPTIAVSRVKSRDPSPVVDRRHNSSFSTSTSNLSKYGHRSRDPSPITDIRLTVPSPARSNLRARSRDPSPVDSRFKSSVGSVSGSYGSNYRSGPRSSVNYGSKYGSSNPSTSSASRNILPENALSYMSVSDFRARSVSRTHDCTKKLEKLNLNDSDVEKSRVSRMAEGSDLGSKSADHVENESNACNVEPEAFISVTVVTRGTSPTPPGASSFVRTRRTDLAKTIEKTVQKSNRKPQFSDKEIQSDRLDDSARYSRFNSANRISAIPWSPYTETKLNRSDSSKYSGSSSSSKNVKNEPEISEKRKKDESSSKSSIRSNGKQEKTTKSTTESKASKSSSKHSNSLSKQKSLESRSNSPSRALPPAVPKSESPTKNMSSSSASSRWPNKDFRKSVLNIGPTDRPRKSRTPSTGTDTDEKCDQAKIISLPARGERSPSVGSEASAVSTSTATSSGSSSADDLKRCHPSNGKTSPIEVQIFAAHECDKSSSVPVPTEHTGSYNKINSGSFGALRDHQQNPTILKIQARSSQNTSPVDSSAQLVAKNEETRSFLIRKLGSVSNFFVSRTLDTSGETIYLDNSSGNSISDGLKEDRTTATVSHLLYPTVAKTSNTKTDSDFDESSWWQNTSQQINTESALDLRDDMKYKLRHIDSGETAWWMRNEDEDDTLAVDLKTLNQQDDLDRSENTDRSFTNEKRSESIDKSWWPTSNSESTQAEKPSRIRSIESGERAWWMNENTAESPPEPAEGNLYSGNQYNNQRLSSVNEDTSEFQRDDADPIAEPIQDKNKYKVPWWMTENSQDPRKDGSPFKIRHVQSGEKAWWLNSSNDSPSRESAAQRDYRYNTSNGSKIRNVESAEKAWWIQDDSVENGQIEAVKEPIAPEDDEIRRATKDFYYNIKNRPAAIHQSDERIPPLGDRASPEGLEDTSIDRKSPHHKNNNIPPTRKRSDKAPLLFISRHTNIDELLGGSCRPLSPLLNRFLGKDGFFEEISPNQVRIHDSTPQMPVIQRMDRDAWDFAPSNQQLQYELDDAAIQVYKDGDYGAYLDLESSLAEQAEEIEGLDSSRKNSLVVRTQLSVRVHTIIEKLLSSEGSELRRALFSLKQIFQEDKDLVHGFVALGGLNCLVRVGNVADQNYQNYILRALGQVMLYVDGMNGVMKHSPTIQWLYSLIASKYRLVVKTALKLLLVFVEYVESNCNLLVQAVHAVDKAQGTLPWSNIMKLLKDYENADTELLIYATSLINKTLSGLSDQDSFYDESDFLEQQGMEGVIQRYMSRPGTDLDLLDQLQLYEAVLKFEDGETDGIRIPANSVRKTLRLRANTDSTERRKSRRHSTGTSPSMSQNLSSPKRYTPPTHGILDEDSSSSNNSNEFSGGVFRDCKGQREGAGVTPGLRRRRERAERQKSFMKEQQEAAANGIRSPFDKNGDQTGLDSECEEKKLVLQIRRDHTVKDLTQKLTNLPTSPQEDKQQNRIGDMTGLISKAKEGLAKSKSKGDISRSPSVDQEIKKSEPKKSENELHWEELVKSMSRPLTLCDLDFTDLNDEDEKDVLAPRGLSGAIPPPPPPIGIPPPISGMGPPFNGKLPFGMNFPPPPTNLVPPPGFGYNNYNKPNNDNGSLSIKKNKKTVKLFWKEVREDMIPPTISKTIWDELPKTVVDIQKLEHLFESRAKDLITKEKQQELNKSKEIIVLDHKRSNAINIAMTKLPPPRAIKAAILKMDQTVVTREGIDKLLNMLPTDEERGKIQEAQMSNPELPLGSAEQFLLTLSSISELSARLKLWAFKLDFENTEKEIVEPLNDLKQGVELLKANRTFKCILSTLLSVGIFLNGAPVKGFQIEYLSKVPEVKDTVHKHSLLHHLCHMVMESSPDTTDLYSEIGPITRASKADFTELAHNLAYLETECKASWDRLKLIAKHDCAPQLKQKLVDFLADCAERIIILEIVHRRVINRYRKFLLWLGVPQHRVSESRPNEFCRIVSEFALEYRTTRERVQQQIEKKANHRERNKTRGKMIIDVAKFRSQEDRADAELKQLLGSPSPRSENPDGTLTWRRRRAENLRSPIIKQNEESFTDGDDEILESLVKTATKAPGSRPTPRERKRTRHADRKSLKRSRTREGFTVERNAASPEY